MNDRPFTTLFLLTSVDGKISTGASDVLDVDKDLPSIRASGKGFTSIMRLKKQPVCGR